MDETSTSSAAADDQAVMPQFSNLDYCLFASMLLISMGVGIYYGFIKKSKNVRDYLHGGQRMGSMPVALSLIASYVSGISVLGIPADIYNYGTQYFALVFCIIPVILIIAYCILPVFYDLQYTTSFEYLEHRFGRSARQVISFIFILSWLLYIPIIVYVPCLALNQEFTMLSLEYAQVTDFSQEKQLSSMTGINIHVISPLAALVCIFYTSLGGLKAVVWTDALQLLILFISFVVIIILGVVDIGGFSVVFERSAEGGRLELFNMDPSLFTRSSLLGVVAFYGPLSLSMWGTSPTAVQRYLSVPTLSAARRTAFLLAFGYFIIVCLSVFKGLLIYATYHDCDPLLRKVVKKADQISPYFVMDVGRKFPGLAGIFVAGVFSAALSTMSTGLNTMTAAIYKDFVEHILPRKLSERSTHLSMKAISFGIGGFCVSVMFLVEKLGGILQMAISLGGICGGAELGIFMLGMFVPWANLKGALAGIASSVVTMAMIVIGGSVSQARGLYKFPILPSRTDGCSSNVTLSAPPEPASHEAFPLFRISYFYYALIGFFVTIVVGVVVSFLTGPNNPSDVDPRYLSPVVRKFFKRRDATAKSASPVDVELCEVSSGGKVEQISNECT